MEIDVGQLIAGKYELVRLIGKGAMGEVWLATHNSLGGEFAIKLVKPGDDVDDDNAAGRFQLEAQISAKLSRRTRHIIAVSDHGEENGLAYLVMELLEGESLEQRIQRSGALSLAETVAIVMQISRALEQAHNEGIFHRDLKPANVFVTRDEDGRMLVKVLDFGIARSKKPFRTRSPVMTGKDMVLVWSAGTDRRGDQHVGFSGESVRLLACGTRPRHARFANAGSHGQRHRHRRLAGDTTRRRAGRVSRSARPSGPRTHAANFAVW